MIIEKLMLGAENSGMVKTARNGAKKAVQELSQAEINEIPFLKEFVGHIKNPSVKLGIKDYNDRAIIAGVIKSDETPIARLAMDLDSSGGKVVINAKGSIGENGEVANAALLADTGKKLDILDMEYALSSKQGKISAQAKAGDAFTAYGSMDTKKMDAFSEKYHTNFDKDDVIYSPVEELQKSIIGKFNTFGEKISTIIKKS